MCKRLILRFWQMPPTKLGLYLVIASLLGWAVVLGGCEHKGGATAKPDDSTKRVDTMRIDAVCQWYDNEKVDAFDWAADQTHGYFNNTGLNLQIAPADTFAFAQEEIPDETETYEAIWNGGHKRYATFPFFVFSARRVSCGEQVPGGYVLGCTRQTRVCSPGSWPNFASNHDFCILAYDRLLAFEQAAEKKAIWGLNMAHELGHLYACLRDYDENPIDHYFECAMHRNVAARSLDLTWVLDYISFCPGCKAHIKTVVEDTDPNKP